jgi:hypothetical protein
MLKLHAFLGVNVLLLLQVLSFVRVASAEAPRVVKMTEAEITTDDGLAWGARDWPYNTLVEIVKNKADNDSIGRAVLDRHGVDNPVDPIDQLLNFLLNPFSAPNPVRVVFISTWSARQYGCEMELLVQAAPPPKLSAVNLSSYLIPTKVELQLGDGIVALKPKGNEAKHSSFPLSYYFYSSELKQFLPSIWYMARNQFVITDRQVNSFIKNSPRGKANLLITFPTGKYVFPIGEGTTKLWPSVYTFNQHCSPDQPTQKISISTQVFRPRKANEIPSPGEFEGAEKIADRYIKSLSLLPEARLTAVERQQRLKFQQGWAKKNEKVVKFLGAWKRDEEAVYVYPSQKPGWACVITERKPSEMTFQVGYTYAGNELLYSTPGNKRQDSLYNRDQPDYLLLKEYGPNLLRPAFATQKSPNLPNHIQKQLEGSGCPTAFVPPPST